VITDRTQQPFQRIVSDEKESKNRICPYLPGQPIIDRLTGQPHLALMGCIGSKCRLYTVKGCGKALDDKLMAEKLMKTK